jgi:hypothetical protein
MRLEAASSDGMSWRIRTEPGDPDHSFALGHEHWTHQGADDAEALRVPEVYRPRAKKIIAALSEGRSGTAARLAWELYNQTMIDHGEGHPYALRARELQAHAMLESGDPVGAAVTYIAVALVWGGTAYWGAAERAYACWQRIEESAPSLDVGEQLVRALRLGGGGTAPLMRCALARLEGLRLRAAA